LDELQPTWTEVSRTADRRKSREHQLVLQAMGIPHGTMHADGTLLLLVRTEDGARATEQIERYERENVGWPPREDVPAPISDGAVAIAIYAAILLGLYALDHGGASNGANRDLWSVGAAVAGKIRAGEVWRAITALTLHTDLSHVVGNLLFGGVFGWILARSVGAGFAWAGFVLAGALGNLLNALLQPADHVSIGASTGVFGALGIQVAFEWTRRRETGASKWRTWVPIAMGLALFLWLGTGGGSFSVTDTARETQRKLTEITSHVDVMAHVTGAAVGLLIGIALATLRNKVRFRGRVQTVTGAVTIAAVGVAWWIALHS
jgi:membrane associated rhomboid family serine protease